MARTPVGTKKQSHSHTAIAANVAAGLAGIRTGRTERDDWLHVHGLAVRSNALERVAARKSDGVRAWKLVEEDSLGLDLEKALVVFPGDGRRRDGLFKSLRDSGLARQLLLTRSRRDVICILIYRRESREAAFKFVESLSERFLWDEILDEDRAVEGHAWIQLAREFAKGEELVENT